MKNYFENCNTTQEAKNEFRKLAKQFHPDLAGEEHTATMQEINNQFAAFKPNQTAFETEAAKFTESADDWAKIVLELLKIEGIEFELAGSWIWITKSSKDQKDKIKAVNFEGKQFESYKRPLWSKNKKCWYFAPKGYRKSTKKSFSLDDIRSAYNTQQFKGKGPKALK